MSGVVVVGSANMDVVARVPRIPGPGETLLATGFSRGGGGKGANQAVAAARAGGADTSFVGLVGADSDGAELRASIGGAGVRIDVLGTHPAEPTGTALIAVSDDGENSIVVVGGANGAFASLSSEQSARVASAAVVLAQLEVSAEVVLAAARARAAGATFVLNAAPSAPLAPELLAEIDVLVVNEHEAIDLAGAAGAGSLDASIDALAARVPALVVTLGGEGSLVMSDGGARHRVPATRVQPVDTTGAGDTFCGVLAARLAAGDALVEAARWGSVAAALAVQRVGAQSAVPSAEETRAAFAAAGPAAAGDAGATA